MCGEGDLDNRVGVVICADDRLEEEPDELVRVEVVDVIPVAAVGMRVAVALLVTADESPVLDEDRIGHVLRDLAADDGH